MAPSPSPLKTILSRVRYPYAVAVVSNGSITNTLSYQTTVEECFCEVQKWRSAYGRTDRMDYVMAEMRDLDNTESYSHWVAI